MNFIPKNSKYKKSFKFKLNIHKKEKRSNSLVFGNYGIFSKEVGFLNSTHIEAIRRVLSKKLKKKGNYWIRIFPYIPVTKKSIGVRMGKGKGNVSYWVFPVFKNRILFEFDGVSQKEANLLFNICSIKFPIKTILFIKQKFI